MQMSMLLSFKNWLVKIDHDGIFLTPSVNMMDFNKVERNRRSDTQQWPTKDPSAHTEETEMLHLKKVFKTPSDVFYLASLSNTFTQATQKLQEIFDSDISFDS